MDIVVIRVEIKYNAPNIKYTLPSKNNYTHTKFDIHFQDSLNLN